jgi:hypothetical protein
MNKHKFIKAAVTELGFKKEIILRAEDILHIYESEKGSQVMYVEEVVVKSGGNGNSRSEQSKVIAEYGVSIDLDEGEFESLEEWVEAHMPGEFIVVESAVWQQDDNGDDYVSEDLTVKAFILKDAITIVESLEEGFTMISAVTGYEVLDKHSYMTKESVESIYEKLIG